MNYIIRAIQKEDRHLVEDAQGTTFSEVILNDRKRKIYVDPNCVEKRELRYYIEFETFNIWIIAKGIQMKKSEFELFIIGFDIILVSPSVK